MLIKTEAFVLKSQKYRESDSLIVLFSRKLGKISAVAKGSRRAKSQMLAGIQPFCHSDFLLYQGRSLYTVNQVEAKQIFYPLREDYQRLMEAAYLVELVDIEINEGQPHPRLYSLFGTGLTLLSRNETELNTLTRAFEVHYTRVCGYAPQTMACVACGIAYSEQWSFSAAQGGILCGNCRHQDPQASHISPTCLKLLRYLGTKPLQDVVRLKIHQKLNDELQQLMRHYLLYHMERHQFRSQKLLQQQGFLPVIKGSEKENTSTTLTETGKSGTVIKTESGENSDEQKE
ncbi:DNA repair protein RecO [Anoxynatronum buryatiense]|uniref:DNA repair protein RecO n=1 Tax=Anoxynatronum buryatiense TaxID=489973 RepID=A0AA45WSU3_9CLOT|nr:DNA repair protein RecO [Anoxynatronum buryatiense]SMP39434.1 DNA replication and repair protein RecO [Anoxynatronum buryatiense]